MVVLISSSTATVFWAFSSVVLVSRSTVELLAVGSGSVVFVFSPFASLHSFSITSVGSVAAVFWGFSSVVSMVVLISSSTATVFWAFSSVVLVSPSAAVLLAVCSGSVLFLFSTFASLHS